MLFRDQDNSSFSNKSKASASTEKTSLKHMLISSMISAPIIFSANHSAFAVSKNNELLEKKADAEYCAPDLLAFPNHSKPDSSGLLPIVLEADDVTAEGEKKVILSGDSFVAQGRQSVNAETIIYDRENDQVQANGDVELRSVAGDLVTADRVDLDVNTLLGNAENAEYRLAKRGRITDKTNAVEVQSRGSAETVSMEGEDFVRLKNAEYTLILISFFSI